MLGRDSDWMSGIGNIIFLDLDVGSTGLFKMEKIYLGTFLSVFYTLIKKIY